MDRSPSPGASRDFLHDASRTSVSSFAVLPHSLDVKKTQHNFSRNTMQTLTLCQNEKKPDHLLREEARRTKPAFVLKKTLEAQHQLAQKCEQVSSKLSTHKIYNTL